jgi:hypothetical protein
MAKRIDHDREQQSLPRGAVRRRAWIVPAVVVVVALLAVLGMKAAYRVSALPSLPSRTQAGGGELRVSRDFGSRTLLQRKLSVPASATALGLLSANANVRTSYGGAFVNSIDGIASTYGGAGGPQADWFYYVNGMQATVGSAQYRLRANDRVWWDFHRWEFAASVPAVVGQYPAPFVSARDGGRARPAAVVCAPGSERSGALVADGLRRAGVASVTVAAWPSAVSVPSGSNLLLVGTWAQLSSLATVRSAAENPRTSGLLARFDSHGVTALDALGRTGTELPSAGAIMAMCREEDPQAAMWLVTGSQTTDAAAAAGVLANRSAELQGRFGVVVTRSGSLIALPAAAKP